MNKQETSSTTNTFQNLPAEKQDRILRIAVEEFAANGYQKASLNTIVKRLGIAKGSLYQYFKNKETLFYYIFERFTLLVKQTVKEKVSGGNGNEFFGQVKEIMEAGIRFIDEYPDYFQIYLKILFEQDVPRREELVAQVRLFSMEYFGPLCEQAKQRGEIKQDVAPAMVGFALDAMLDRFLQGYAQPYLDGGLGLADKNKNMLFNNIDAVIEVLRDGLSPRTKGV